MRHLKFLILCLWLDISSVKNCCQWLFFSGIFHQSRFFKSWNFEDSLFDLVLLMRRRFKKLDGNWLNFQRKLHQSLLTWSSPDLFKQINWKADFRQQKSKYQLKGENYIEREIFIRHLSEAMLCQTTCAIGGGINTTIISCTFFKVPKCDWKFRSSAAQGSLGLRPVLSQALKRVNQT